MGQPITRLVGDIAYWTPVLHANIATAQSEEDKLRKQAKMWTVAGVITCAVLVSGFIAALYFAAPEGVILATLGAAGGAILGFQWKVTSMWQKVYLAKQERERAQKDVIDYADPAFLHWIATGTQLRDTPLDLRRLRRCLCDFPTLRNGPIPPLPANATRRAQRQHRSQTAARDAYLTYFNQAVPGAAAT